MNNRQITIPMVTRTALHVGAGYGDAVTDGFVRKDAQGRTVIPGTSIAGAMRVLATRLAPRLGLEPERIACKALTDKDDRKPCGCIVCRLFGDVNPGEPEAGSRNAGAVARAARLWVYDIYPIGGSPTVRDGVGIERAARTAYRQGQIKFDFETLPPGTRFELKLELACPTGADDGEDEERLLAAVLAEWVSGRGTIGGRTSRGLGRIEIEKDQPAVFRELDFSKPADLMAFLAQDNPWQGVNPDPGWLARRVDEIRLTPPSDSWPTGTAGCWARLMAEIEVAGPFLVNNPVTSAESGFDNAPVLADGRPLLPGSTIKGVLRSQAERIVRTLATQAAGNLDHFLRTCPACSPISSRDLSPEPLESCDSLLDAYQVVKTTDEVEDRHQCLACRLFGSTRRGSRLRVEDARLVGSPVYKPLDFLAIDRFTGGGADQFKFDAVVLWQPCFEVSLFLDNPEPWELGWLFLAMRDLHEGLASLGFGASKGFGRARAKAWRVEFGTLDDSDAARMSIPSGGLRQEGSLYRVLTFDSAKPAVLRPALDGWIEAFEKQVTAFAQSGRDTGRPPHGLPALERDTYFGTGLETLYREEVR